MTDIATGYTSVSAVFFTNLMAEVANTWPLELTENTIMEATTTIKSER